MSVEAPRQYDPTALLPIITGLAWLLGAHGIAWLICALLPGGLLLASGTSALLWPGEGKISQYMALGGLLGVVLSLPALLFGGFGVVMLLTLASAACFVVAGRSALVVGSTTNAPNPGRDPATYAKAALDEALVGYFVAVAKVPSGAAAERMCRDALKLEAVLGERGAFDDPAGFHAAPGVPDDPRLTTARGAGFEFQNLQFASGYSPTPELPGGDLWPGYTANRTCNVNLFRRSEPGRPWLLCIHGYRMGMPFLDLRLFPPALLHQRYRLNMVLPTLPLHGTRRCGLQSGDRFLDGNLLDLLHAETQTLWDLRRTIAWIRAQEPDAKIGVLGYSLGGYNAALLASHEPGLDFVVAGIPVCDFASTLWQHIPAQHRRYFAEQGLDQDRYRRLLQVVSPVTLAPKLASERLHIFAGVADRIVLPPQPLQLAQHWGRAVQWYPGGHLTFRGERAVDRCIEDAMTSAGWTLRDAN
ncbi:MAG: alpha/beta hydrolase [Nevskia sp.]|jgi:hypothetical protein|nr:alpha/beta hydrolase [Nevskia sp.]MCK9385447.1 alpha/beta hydrolase [Nevskia sp.]